MRLRIASYGTVFFRRSGNLCKIGPVPVASCSRMMVYRDFSEKGGATVRKRALALTCVVVGLLGGGAERVFADTVLNIGSTYGSPYEVALLNSPLEGHDKGVFVDVGAGTFVGGTLSGYNLAHANGMNVMYCVDLTHFIYLGTPYPGTKVNTVGYIGNQVPVGQINHTSTTAYSQGTSDTLTNAAGIAYVLRTYFATDGNGHAVTLDSSGMFALQLSIWHLAYGDNFEYHASVYDSVSGTSASTVSGLEDKYYKAGLLHAGDGPSSDVVWINPLNNGSDFTQAQVGLVTPLPGNLVMSSIFLGMIAAGSIGRRLKKVVRIAA